MHCLKTIPPRAKVRLTLFAAVVGVFVVVISARLLLVTGIPRTATADPKDQPVAAPVPTGATGPSGAPGATGAHRRAAH